MMIKQCGAREIALHYSPPIVPVSVSGRYPSHTGAYNAIGLAESSDASTSSSEEDEGPDGGEGDSDNGDSADERHPLLVESRGGGGVGGEVALAAGSAAANAPEGVVPPEDTEQAKVSSYVQIFFGSKTSRCSMYLGKMDGRIGGGGRGGAVGRCKGSRRAAEDGVQSLLDTFSGVRSRGKDG